MTKTLKKTEGGKCDRAISSAEISKGVADLLPAEREALIELLTFEALPTAEAPRPTS